MRVFKLGWIFLLISCNQFKVSNEGFWENFFLLNVRLNRVTLNGSAVKGVVRNADVRVVPVDEQGSCNSNSLIAQGKTNDLGFYSVTVPRSSYSTVCVIVAPSSKFATTMYDEKSTKDISLSPDSDFKLVSVYPLEKLGSNTRKTLFLSPFTRMLANRIEFLKKQNPNASLTSLHTQASRELVIRFGLNKGLNVANRRSLQKKEVSVDSVPDLEDITIELDNPQSELTAKFVSVLAGMSQLASKLKEGNEVSYKDLDSVITAFAKDFEDGAFDGKTAEGNSISLGRGENQINFSNDPLSTVLLPAVQEYVAEGGSLSVGIPTQTAPPTIDANEIANQIQFAGNTTISLGENAVATPTFSPSAGLVTTLSNITITTTTEGASIYYTTDGSTPSTNSTLYTSPLQNVWILAGKIIKAIAVKTGMTNSAVLSGIFSYPPLKTGQTSCWDANGTSIACSNTGQDGEYQKGVARSFTDNGDGTVTDNATGLIWQKCSMGQNNDSSCSGPASEANSWSDAVSYCNGLTLAGKTWRLPNIYELQTLVDYGAFNPAINTTYFPSTQSSAYWSSTTYVIYTGQRWAVFFSNGSTTTYFDSSSTIYVRCVSGPSKGYVGNFTDNGDGTVTDNATGLIWQKCSRGQSGSDCTTNTAESVSWSNALSYCNGLNLANRTWRLPNVNELYSLADVSRSFVIDTSIFPNTASGEYWTSSTNTNTNTTDTDKSWTLSNEGYVASLPKSSSYTYYVRCVSGP